MHCCFTSHKHFFSRPAGLICAPYLMPYAQIGLLLFSFFFKFSLVSFKMSGTVVTVECQSDIFSTMFLYIKDYINSSSYKL